MSGDEGDYTLSEPFDIDTGELDGLSLQQAFVLGYELRQIHVLLDRRKPFSKLIRTKNIERVQRSAIRRRVPIRIQRQDKDWAFVSCRRRDSGGQA